MSGRPTAEEAARALPSAVSSAELVRALGLIGIEAISLGATTRVTVLPTRVVVDIAGVDRSTFTVTIPVVR